MKLLVLGDIHGNLLALEKVFSLYLTEVDGIVCHGDVVNYGPWSNECVELLEQEKAICLKGNHEYAFINGFYPGNNGLVKDFFKVTFPEFVYIERIKKYGDVYEINDFTITHTLNDKYYYPDTDITDLHLVNNTIIGHSHYSFKKQLNNGKLLVNTGSVGQNRRDLSIIDFAIVDLKENDVELKSIQYNPMPLIVEMRRKGYPENCLDYYINKIRK